jgi:hypothetical protein
MYKESGQLRSVSNICSDNCALQKPVQAFRGLILSCYPVETCVDQKFLKHLVFIALSAAVKNTFYIGGDFCRYFHEMDKKLVDMHG